MQKTYTFSDNVRGFRTCSQKASGFLRLHLVRILFNFAAVTPDFVVDVVKTTETQGKHWRGSQTVQRPRTKQSNSSRDLNERVLYNNEVLFEYLPKSTCGEPLEENLPNLWYLCTTNQEVLVVPIKYWLVQGVPPKNLQSAQYTTKYFCNTSYKVQLRCTCKVTLRCTQNVQYTYINMSS